MHGAHRLGGVWARLEILGFAAHHLEDLEEKLRLYVKALRDGKNFSARKATDKERKLEEECLKELGIGEQSAPTRLDNLAQDLARYILTPKVDESGNETII